MAQKSNESVNINRAAMVAFGEYLRKLTSDLESSITNIGPAVKAMSDEDGLIAGKDMEQTRGMYSEVGINLTGVSNKLKEANQITAKYIDVQSAVSATGVKTTEELHSAAVVIAQKLKSGNSLK